MIFHCLYCVVWPKGLVIGAQILIVAVTRADDRDIVDGFTDVRQQVGHFDAAFPITAEGAPRAKQARVARYELVLGFAELGRPRLAVGAIVLTMGLPQPAVSKHLGVLRDAGIVSSTKQGKSRVYELNPSPLRPIYDWVKTIEEHWDRQLDRVRARAERIARSRSTTSDSTSNKKEPS